MRIISRGTLKAHWAAYPDSEGQLRAWYTEAKAASWANPAEIKEKYGNASILKDGRAVFNICGNKYRLVVWINYAYHVVYIRFVGTHEAYDAIDAQTI